MYDSADYMAIFQIPGSIFDIVPSIVVCWSVWGPDDHVYGKDLTSVQKKSDVNGVSIIARVVA